MGLGKAVGPGRGPHQLPGQVTPRAPAPPARLWHGSPGEEGGVRAAPVPPGAMERVLESVSADTRGPFAGEYVSTA